jgi:hypothetical protein
MVPEPHLRCKTTPAGNRQRPPHGGSHDRRTRGSSSSHHPAPRRPTCQRHLRRRRPLRGLVPQVVGPLLAGRARGSLRPYAGQPPRRPAHVARTGENYPLRPPSATGPRHAGHSLQPARGHRHRGRAEVPEHSPASLRAHHRTRPGTQRPDRTAGPPGPATTTPGVPRSTGPRVQPTARGRSGGTSLSRSSFSCNAW